MKGGLADGKTFQDIANHHNISLEQLQSEFNKGVVVEKEHTSDFEIATQIAKDHLWEDKDYYTKLKYIENSRRERRQLGTLAKKSKLIEALNKQFIISQ